MKTAAAILLGIGTLSGASVAAAQTVDSRISACIANNSARYAESSSATVAQYFSVAAACRASVQGRPGIEVVLAPTPAPGRGTPAARSGGPDGRAPGSGTPVPAPRRPGAKGTDAPSAAAPGQAPNGAGSVASNSPAMTAARVRTALASTAASGNAITSPVGALTPIGAGSLAAAALLGVGGFVRRRRSPG